MIDACACMYISTCNTHMWWSQNYFVESVLSIHIYKVSRSNLGWQAFVTTAFTCCAISLTPNWRELSLSSIKWNNNPDAYSISHMWLMGDISCIKVGSELSNISFPAHQTIFITYARVFNCSFCLTRWKLIVLIQENDMLLIFGFSSLVEECFKNIFSRLQISQIKCRYYYLSNCSMFSMEWNV